MSEEKASPTNEQSWRNGFWLPAAITGRPPPPGSGGPQRRLLYPSPDPAQVYRSRDLRDVRDAVLGCSVVLIASANACRCSSATAPLRQTRFSVTVPKCLRSERSCSFGEEAK